MRRPTPTSTLFATLAISGLAVAGAVITAGASAAASAPPSTEPTASTPVTEPVGTASAEITPVDTVAVDAGAGATVVVDESGTPVAQISIVGVDPDWVDYGEFDAPDAGSQYLRATIVVESLSPRGLITVQDDDFVLQDADGFVFTGDVVPTAAQTESDEEIVETIDLANGETVEYPVSFEVVSGVAPAAVFYSPSPTRLVTLTTMS